MKINELRVDRRARLLVRASWQRLCLKESAWTLGSTLGPARQISLSNQPVIRPAIKLKVLSGNEPGLHAAQVGAGVAEFLRRAEAARCDGVDDARARLVHGDAVLAHDALGHEALAVGVDALRQQAVDGNVVARHLERQRFRECCEARARAPVESAIGGRGDFTIAEVMLMMRPNLRSRMPGTSARIRSAGASMFDSSAAIHWSWCQSASLPGGGPALLLTRMSASGQAAISAVRPASVAMSAATPVTLAPVSAAISTAALFTFSAVRPLMTTTQPSRASALAQARPRP